MAQAICGSQKLQAGIGNNSALTQPAYIISRLFPLDQDHLSVFHMQTVYQYGTCKKFTHKTNNCDKITSIIKEYSSRQNYHFRLGAIHKVRTRPGGGRGQAKEYVKVRGRGGVLQKSTYAFVTFITRKIIKEKLKNLVLFFIQFYQFLNLNRKCT